MKTPESARPMPAAGPLRRPAWHLLFAGATLLAPLLGCSAVHPPRPWEKAELARPVMKMDRPPLEAKFVSHVYFSKEATSGGDGVGGGGCGCN